MKKHLIRASVVLALAVGVWAEPSPWVPQIQEIEWVEEEELGDVESDDVPTQDPPAAEAPAAGNPNAQDAAIAPYLQMQPFPRQAKDVLKALADGPPAEPPPDAPEPAQLAIAAQVLRWRMIAGDWAGFAAAIEALPAEDSRAKVYDHACKLLQPPNVLLTAEDVVAFVDASPIQPKANRLRELGALFARAGQASGAPIATLERIRSGTRYLGGERSENRLAAARFLLAAGMPADAEPYLPRLEDARANRNAEVILLHAESLHRRAENESNSALDQAFQLATESLAIEPLDDETRDGALKLCVALLDDPAGHRGEEWLAALLRERAGLGRRWIAALSVELETSSQSPINAPRLSVLRVADSTARALAALPVEIEAGYGDALDLLTASWLLEAGYAIYPDGNVMNSAAPNSPAWFERTLLQQVLQERRKKNTQPIAAEEMLKLAPQGAWINRLDQDLAARVHRYEGLLACSARLEDRAIAFVEREAERNPDLARELVDNYLMWWSRNLGQRPQFDFDEDMGMAYRYGNNYYYGNIPPGVPLTRARQERNLDELAGLALRFEELGFPFTTEGLAAAFSACYSVAEVYRAEDLERVFGDPTQIAPNLIVNLVADMRVKLAGQWRKPSTQQQARTNRTNKQIVAEVTRGYELAHDLLSEVAANVPEHQGLESMIGVLLYDQAEFLYGQKVELKVYIALRDEAFQHLRRGAEIYQRELASGTVTQISAEAYRLWFNAAMGASDLAYLTRQEKPDLDQIAAVGSRLAALPEARRSEHLEAFGRALANSSRQIPPQLKPHYFRQALRILGETKAAKEIENALRTYDELLSELELIWEIDGSAKVGAREFGVLLALRHTRSLDRESGGFNKYMSNKMYSYRTGMEVNYRDDLAQRVREKLVESFEIHSEMPFDPEVGKLGDERFGWERTPLFYLVLSAKDAAVDRLPSVSMDVDFNDPFGYVLLPVESKELTIDARAVDAAARPVTHLEVAQTIDDRKLEKERTLRIEVRASGRGILPPIAELVDAKELAGFKLDRVTDQGLVLTGVDREDGLAVLTERTGALEYTLPEGTELARELAFPTIMIAAATPKYQRFADADIEEVGAVVTMRELSILSPERWGLWALLAGTVIALAVGLWFWQRQLKRAENTRTGPRYEPLREANAFGAVALLKRLAADPLAKFDAEEQSELQSEIARIQREHFAANADRPAADLVQRVNRWIARA